MEEEIKKIIKKNNKRNRLIVILTAVFFFVVGSASSITLYNYFFGGVSIEELKSINQAYNIIKNEWYFGNDELAQEYLDEGLEGLVNGNISNGLTRIDPYLHYTPKSDTDISNEYGLGITVLVDSEGFPLYDGYFYIKKVYMKSAAYGVLQEGDLLTKVNGESIRYKNSSELKIKGEKGTNVEISYLRDGKEYTHTFTRDEVVEHSVSRTLYDGYAVLEIDGFKTTSNGVLGTAELAEKYLKEIKNEDIDNLIIDLRDNPGGYISAFKSLSELFIPKGKSLGSYINKHQEVTEEVFTSSNDDYIFDKILVLINGNSASASESFSACLQDNLNNVYICGTNSYTKGIAQRTITLANGGSLKYTYAEYIRPNGNRLHKIGVKPDVEVELIDTYEIDKNSCIKDGVLDEVLYGLQGKKYYDSVLFAYDQQMLASMEYTNFLGGKNNG